MKLIILFFHKNQLRALNIFIVANLRSVHLLKKYGTFHLLKRISGKFLKILNTNIKIMIK